MEQHCSSCGSALRAGSRFCVRCGQPVQNATVPQPVASAIQSSAAGTQAPLTVHQPVDQSPVTLKISMEKNQSRKNTAIGVYLDRQKIGTGSFKEGIAAQATTTAGKHVLTLAVVETILPTKTDLPFVVSQGGEQLVAITHIRLFGIFKLAIK